jgi:CDP-diacylglycerol--glycerol-3-phosphate 3-phosphatidyltransferase
MNKRPVNVFNLPNGISILRALTVIPVVACLSTPEFGWNLLGSLIFVGASLTDLLDGFLARRRGEVTNAGKLLDPLADKILMLGALLPMIRLGWIPPWLGVVILGREMVVTGLRAIAAAEGTTIAAIQSAKYKTLLYTISFTLLMVHMKKLGIPVLWIAICTSVFSAYKYMKSHWEIITKGGDSQ